jgi:hypothetical protein
LIGTFLLFFVAAKVAEFLSADFRLLWCGFGREKTGDSKAVFMSDRPEESGV